MSDEMNVDSWKIQETMRILGDNIADLGPLYGKIRDEINNPGMMICVAVRSPVNMQHLKVIDQFLKALAADLLQQLQRAGVPQELLQTGVDPSPLEPHIKGMPKGLKELAQAFIWVGDAYEDIKSAVKPR